MAQYRRAVMLACLLLVVAMPLLSSAHVVELNEDTFFPTVSRGNWMVEFYAPWCGFCQRLKPDWERLGKELAETPFPSIGLPNVARIDATKHRAIAKSFGLDSYPYIVYITNEKGNKGPVYHIYPQKQAANLKLLKEFALGKWSEVPPTAFPQRPGLLDSWVDQLEIVVMDLYALPEFPEGTIAIVLGSLLAGMVTSGLFMKWLLASRPSASSKAHRSPINKPKHE